MDDPWRLYTLKEVAALTGLSPRWLADQCRANKIDHTLIENTRRMTEAQITTMISQHRAGPAPAEDTSLQHKYLNRLQKQKRTRNSS